MRFLPPSIVLLLSGCAMFLPAVNPMVSVDDDFEGRGKAKCLVVFLPGVGDIATDFEDKGFVDAVRGRGLSVDLISAQATLSYYAKGTMVERLGEDVFADARRKRYRQTWLIGLSMGGLGTLLYSHDHPTEITGVLALAPFMGGPRWRRRSAQKAGWRRGRRPRRWW
jgi:pimeloyl-ACP methyl ester carboxylesterase